MSSTIEETVLSALEMANRAPSVHNSQPWRWMLEPHSVHLYVDRSRLLPALDPTGLEMVLSCGAALHHARIAFPALGWRARVHRLPNPAQPDHLASIEVGSRRTSDVDTVAVELATAIARRRTDRRPFRPDPVSDRLLTALTGAAGAEDCALVLAVDTDSRRALLTAIEQGGSAERGSAEYRRELAGWTGSRLTFAEGVPARNLPEDGDSGTPARDFGAGELPVPVLDDGAVLGVIATDGDGLENRLRAGEALSAVLLSATSAGLATCPLSQVTEVPQAREAVREQVLLGAGEPQIALRVGWPVTAEFPAPATGRRPVSDSIEQTPL